MAERSIETKSPVSRGALDTGQGAEPSAQLVELLVDVVVGDLKVVDGDGELAERGHGDLGPNVDLGGERDVIAVLELGDLDVGLPERADLALA